MKVESTEGIVKLVAGIQQEEDRITKAAKDKILLEVHQNISRLEVCIILLLRPLWRCLCMSTCLAQPSHTT